MFEVDLVIQWTLRIQIPEMADPLDCNTCKKDNSNQKKGSIFNSEINNLCTFKPELTTTKATILKAQFNFLYHKLSLNKTTCQKRPQFLGPKGVRCTQV
jgi:hypothetical protein